MSEERRPTDARIWTRAPHPALSDLVGGLYAYSGSGAELATVIEPARLVVALIFNFGSRYRIALDRKPAREETFASFVGGLHPGSVWIESGRGAECVQVNLTPLGARRLLRPPMSEFASRLVALDDLADRDLSAFARRLGEVGDRDERLQLTERFLRSRLLACEGEASEVDWALSEICRRSGNLRMGALAKSLGWSRRRFAERFERDVGLPPKAVARIVRFEGAMRLASGRAAPVWSAIAAEAGYADQSHLTREFAALAACSPGRWRSPK